MAAPALHLLSAARTAAAGGFEPTDIAGCQLWLDGDDDATFTYDSGTLVSAWNDKSGGSRHFTQGTSGRFPDRNATLNGLDVVTFDGSNDHLVYNGAVGAAPFTFFAVAKLSVAADYKFLIDSASSPFAEIFRESGAGGVWAFAGSAQLNSATSPDTNAHMFSAHFNGASSELWLDGASIKTGNVGTSGWGSSGVNAILGIHNSISLGWNGVIAEVIVYDTALGSGDRGDVETYLSDKWGL